MQGRNAIVTVGGKHDALGLAQLRHVDFHGDVVRLCIDLYLFLYAHFRTNPLNTLFFLLAVAAMSRSISGY